MTNARFHQACPAKCHRLARQPDQLVFELYEVGSIGHYECVIFEYCSLQIYNLGRYYERYDLGS
jgi:hypothetical protein